MHSFIAQFQINFWVLAKVLARWASTSIEVVG